MVSNRLSNNSTTLLNHGAPGAQADMTCSVSCMAGWLSVTVFTSARKILSPWKGCESKVRSGERDKLSNIQFVEFFLVFEFFGRRGSPARVVMGGLP